MSLYFYVWLLITTTTTHAQSSLPISDSSGLYIIPDQELTFADAVTYCNENYYSLANIYDPNENNILLNLVNLNFIDKAYIGYYKNDINEWKWQSNSSSNPMLFLNSPLASISSNIDDVTTDCMYISRYGWLYTLCTKTINFICETRDHKPEFIESDPFMLSKRKLKFDDARSFCRAQFGYDLATIYEEEEYKIAQSLCSNNTYNNNDTNCWIGYEKGILNDNEWQWIQDLPISVIPINELINIDLWSIFPWQLSKSKIYCQAPKELIIKYSSNGNDFIGNISTNTAFYSLSYKISNVLYQSILEFDVSVKSKDLPGLKCSIYFENEIYNTLVGDYKYWSIINESNDNGYNIVKAYTTYNDNYLPGNISNNSQWIWNILYSNKNDVTQDETLSFQFSFNQVKNIQNKPGDNCASISYYPPNKWKTNNCQERFFPICNKYDHKPKFQISPNEEFALLTDRLLTREESNSLCNNIYGYGLATIYSYYEYKQIYNMLINYNIDDVWIGLLYDNKTFLNSNNFNNNYGWQTQTDFIFDDWTLDIWTDNDPFPQPTIIDNNYCVQQIWINGSQSLWDIIDCNVTSFAVCNYDSHEPEFISSEFGSFYLLQQAQNYKNGAEMCGDWVSTRSQGAIIYHPIENERAIWLCSNATNGKGCFIGYNNIISYNNITGFNWKNGANINVFEYPWFGNPWLNLSNNTFNIDQYLMEKFEDFTNRSFCTAIVEDNITNEWGWNIVDCNDELNILCDSGDDHAQCWMLQTCSECAIRSDCGWCGNQCQLNKEICYYSDELIEQEFGCDDYDPIINITWEKDFNYTFSVNITVCTSTAPDDIATKDLANYVNFSNCVVQSQVIELYIISDYQDATYGNYDILGKVIELRQESKNGGGQTFENITTFEEQPVCDIKVYHGWVPWITCDKNGVGYGNNVTQFDMLHDVLRYLIPRLTKRLFEGYDIAQDSLFGYSTMIRTFDSSSSVDHSIHRKFSNDDIINARYKNATSDLLWEHKHNINNNNNINHVNATMIHVFTHIPHHDSSQQLQLFSWNEYEINLISKSNILSSETDILRQALYALDEDSLHTKNYTINEWRGIRPGNFFYNPSSEQEKKDEQRRRLGFIEGVEAFCQDYDKITETVDKGEVHFGIWGLNLWVSTIVNAIDNGQSFLDILNDNGGYPIPDSDHDPLVIIPDFLELDLGFKLGFAFGWEYESNSESSSSSSDDSSSSSSSSSSTSFSDCPISFKIVDKLMPDLISTSEKEAISKCCSVYVSTQKECDKTFKDAHDDANKCLESSGVKSNFTSKITNLISVLTGNSIFTWDDNYEPPSLTDIIQFVIFFIDEGWDEIIDDMTQLWDSFIDKDSGKSAAQSIATKYQDSDLSEYINFVQELGKTVQEGVYIANKLENCKIKSSWPIMIDFDIVFDFGFTTSGLSDLCQPFASTENDDDDDDEERRRRLIEMTYPIIPDLDLPCIPLYPPFIMLCPSLSVDTRFGLDIEPEISDKKIGLELGPYVGFDITAALSVTIGIWIIDAEIELGITITLVLLQFPFEIGLGLQDFGLLGDIKMDIKVLELTIFLKFKICLHFFFFSICPLDITLWSWSITAWEYEKTFVEYGMGGNGYASTSSLPANEEYAISNIRFIWAFKDSHYKYNDEYDYEWKKDYFKTWTYDTWINNIFDISSCQIKSGNMISNWYNNATNYTQYINITDPYYCKYNIKGFDKLYIQDISIKWYSQLGMKTCFQSRTKQIFEEKLCCNFALNIYDKIEEITGINFDISSYKMIVIDLDQTWSDQCAQFYLNDQVEINSAPYYDDCSDEGWKISEEIDGDYNFDYHVIDYTSLTHYNGQSTCLNLYNSSSQIKTIRTYEIFYPYDFLMIGLRFWTQISSSHSSLNWYGIRIYNETNYYWMSNVNSNCDPTEDAYSNWYPYKEYCYQDVLMYFDPEIDAANQYKFILEIIANVPDGELWGFSHLVFNTFDNEDICINGINPVIKLNTSYTDNIEYKYYGLKNIPSLYYGYVLFDISFDYRFHDISALISLSTNNSNDGITNHWVINFDNDQSGIWIRFGNQQLPSDGILTLNDDLSSIIIDTNIINEDNEEIIEIVYTKMYIQWNSDSDENYMRIGWGHQLGQNIIATIDYDKFQADTTQIIKYVGFARSLGSDIPQVKWKIYTNNLPSFCLTDNENEKIHKTQNYKQTCIENESGSTELIIYDLVTPNCIYHTRDLSNNLSYTFTITQQHDYVMMSIKLFADFKDVATTNGICYVDDQLDIYYASDGDHYYYLTSANCQESGVCPDSTGIFYLNSISHLSRLRFEVTNAVANTPGFLYCSLSINGQTYITSDDSDYWKIIKADKNGKIIYTGIDKSISNDATYIWNTDSSSNEIYTVIFEFSFTNVYGTEYIEIDIGGQPNKDTKIIPKWDPNLDRTQCKENYYSDGLYNSFTPSCYGTLNATFEHLSQEQTFTISFLPNGVDNTNGFGIADIELFYGLCYDVLQLITKQIRYDTEYTYLNNTLLQSISYNYLFVMVKSELDSYESSESYISFGTENSTQPRFIVRFYENMIEILTSSNSTEIDGDSLIANTSIDNVSYLINNTDWFEFYVEWDKDEGYFRVGTGYILGENVLISINFYELYSSFGTVIDTVGILHCNKDIIRDWNIITFQFVPTNEPKLCWTSELESVAIKSWINTDMNSVWMTSDDIPTKRIPTALTTSLIFNGPFASNDKISKSLTSIYEHDYIQLQTKIYGFGLWNVLYPIWLNGFSLFLNENDENSLIWFGTFLNDGGVTGKKCDISEYKQWFNWSEPSSLNGLPLDILTNTACSFDINLYFKHNLTNEPFTLLFNGNLKESECNAIAQFDIKLDDSSDTNIDGYPLMLNKSLKENNYKYCSALCNDNDECRAWSYNVSGYCWLKTTSDINIKRQGGYISGICDGQNIYDGNSSCLNGESLIQFGYKTDVSHNFQQHTLYNYIDIIIECEADNLLQISKSIDNGKTFEIIKLSSNLTMASEAYLTISNLTYVSQLKFDITNNGFESNNYDNYYGFQSADNDHFFIHHCNEKLYLGNFSQTNDRIISNYQWQIIEPGLNGQDNTISIKGKYFNGNEMIERYITIYDPSLEIKHIYTHPQGQFVRIECIADDFVNVSFAKNGFDFTQIAYNYKEELFKINITNVTQKSKLRFSVYNRNYSTTNPGGLGCNIYTNLSIITTNTNITDYWSIIDASKGNTTIEQVTFNKWSSPKQRIWNYNCTQMGQTPLICRDTTVLFEFSFENVFDNVSMKTIDNIISSSSLTLPSSMNGPQLNEQTKIVCQAGDALNISFAENGYDFTQIGYSQWPNLIEINLTDINNLSKLRFSVIDLDETVTKTVTTFNASTNTSITNNITISADDKLGLRCSIYSSLFVISTSNDSQYWNIIDDLHPNASIKIIPSTNNDSSNIETNAKWIWYDQCDKIIVRVETNVTTNETITKYKTVCKAAKSAIFELSFADVRIYNYDMSTFKISQCTESQQKDAFMIKGVNKYSNVSFNVNNKYLSISSNNECENESDITINNSASTCWYIRNANPKGLACELSMNNQTYVTDTNEAIWSSTNNIIIEVNNKYWNDPYLNVTEYDGSWIFNRQCLPINNTDCIDNYDASFIFNLKEIFPSPINPDYTKCQEKCESNDECDGWIYRYANDTVYYPQCYLKTDLPIGLIADDQYITGLYIKSDECDCICGDCYPGNKYHYLYIETEDELINHPLYQNSTLYSHSCDFSLHLNENDDLILKNIASGNILNTISNLDFQTLIESESWIYPVRIILEGPILIITDDDLTNTSITIYQNQCAIKYIGNERQLSLSGDTLGDENLYFYITQEFSVQFTLNIDNTFKSSMQIMTLIDDITNEIHFTFGWDDSNTTYIEWKGNQYTVTDNNFNKIHKGETHWTIKVTSSKLQIWALGEKQGYQSFSLNGNRTNNSDYTPILSKVYTVKPNGITNNAVYIEFVCISDLPFEQFKSNENEFDYGMRCWSGKYKNINRKNEFISSFVSSSGCASVTSSCSTSFGEDLQYLPYYETLTEQEFDLEFYDPSCFNGQFSDYDSPPTKNKLCIMLQKCQSPKQSLYTKSWGFSGVNVSISNCQDITPNVTKKISIEWDDEFDINYGTLTLGSNDIYTINNNFLIFELRPIRWPSSGFSNRSVYISFMNLNDSVYGQQDSNITWTFELNNEFGVKFYRGDRNQTERLIASKYVENILKSQTESDVRGYCFADNQVNITYASDGDNYIEIITNYIWTNMIEFTLNDVSYVSSLRFLVTNKNISGDVSAGLVCTIYVNGAKYSTSTNSAYWTIIKSSIGGTNIISRDVLNEWQTIQYESEYISNDAEWIWNYDCNSTTSQYCKGGQILFEFSFFDTINPDNAPSFYFEWDDIFGDYMRFGFYNKSNSGLSYKDNFDLILETGYISNFYSYDISYDGYFGYHQKIYITDVMFSIKNNSYNEDWFILINILNSSDPKPCFGYDLLNDKETRITTRDLQTNSLWKDDGKAMNWKLNGNILPGWHTIKYLNTTKNTTYNRLIQFPYYFHYPFVSNQQSLQRSFLIDSDIDYDYLQIEFDIFTFCGWDYKTDSLSVSLAFEEYLEFTQFWYSTHITKTCQGYNTPQWMNVLDIVRMNNETHEDISCYVQGMISPSYQCNLYINTISLTTINENANVNIKCKSLSKNGIIQIKYSIDGSIFNNQISNKSMIGLSVSHATRDSKLKIRVTNQQTTDDALKCNISVDNTTYYTNTSNLFWNITDSYNGNKAIITKNSSLGATSSWIWNTNNETLNISSSSWVEFEFNFWNVFIQESHLIYTNTQQINISNNTNLTAISFEATALTTCKLTFNSNGKNITIKTIQDSYSLSSDNSNDGLNYLLNTPIINYIFIDLMDYDYICRLDLYSQCNFKGDLYRIDSSKTNISLVISNTSSWRLYAERGYECYAKFYNSLINKTFIINAEDGGMISESCNTLNPFNSINITYSKVHYGCYQHVTFQTPNTNSQPFVLRIESEIDDISTKFGSYVKSWGFGNLSITPLICSSFSNIIPLKTPIMLSYDDESITMTSNELSSLQYEYLFLLINNKKIHLDLLMGDSTYYSYFWKIFISSDSCQLQNMLLWTTIDCSDNENYLQLIYNNTSSNYTQELIWISWDPFNVESNYKNFSFGVGSTLNEKIIASLSIYGINNIYESSEINNDDNLNNSNFYIDEIKFIAPSSDYTLNITISPIQFSTPKICLSQWSESNKIDLGNTWNDDCNEKGWELRKYTRINDNNNNIEINNETYSDQCLITNLNINSVSTIESQCFHGPFQGSSINNYGDYISRYFYVLTDDTNDIKYDIIEINLDYYSLCTWNPEKFENDTGYIFINKQGLWRSAPKYEFVNEYCEGYSLYSDWILFTDYDNNILNTDKIQCLSLLDQICSYPVSFKFRHTSSSELYFSVGFGAKLNQLINNEAFGFGNISISYEICPEMAPIPIGNVTSQPLYDLDSYIFQQGDMLVISSSSGYYLVADYYFEYQDFSYYVNKNISNGCIFTLYGGYKMWSQLSKNCTISGLPIMRNYPQSNYELTLELGISDDGTMSLQTRGNEEILWSRRTHCDTNYAYYYYAMNKTQVLTYSNNIGIYSLDCKWAMIITRGNEDVEIIKNIDISNYDTVDGQTVARFGNGVTKITFDSSGSLVIIGNDEILPLSDKGGDFMMFDSGKLAIFDYDTNTIINQHDFQFSTCTLDQNIGFIKYHYFMKPGDILWNGEALISQNCQYKLILLNGNLMILDGNNEIIWKATHYYNDNANTTTYDDTDSIGAEKFLFQTDGNMVLYSYSSNNEILWQSQTSTLLNRDSIFYADRAVLDDNGTFFIIDNATFTIHFNSNKNTSYDNKNEIAEAYNYHLNCDSSKYDYIDKSNGFYATWVSYYNCDKNEFIYNKTTSCIAYKYCSIIAHWSNVFLEPYSANTNCRKYTNDYWRKLSNNYVLFQISIANTGDPTVGQTELYLVLSQSNQISFGNEFDSQYLNYRTMLIKISAFNKTVCITTKHGKETYFIPGLFSNDTMIEWFWIDWEPNFDYIGIGNSQYMTQPLYKIKYSKFIKDKLNRKENLFNYLNMAWSQKAYNDKCYGYIIIQFPPLEIEIAKGCYEHSTTIIPTLQPTPFITTQQITTQTTNNNNNNNGSSSNINKLSAAIIVIIVLSSLCFIISLILIIMYYLRKKRMRNPLIAREIDLKLQKSVQMEQYQLMEDDNDDDDDIMDGPVTADYIGDETTSNQHEINNTQDQ